MGSRQGSKGMHVCADHGFTWVSGQEPAQSMVGAASTCCVGLPPGLLGCVEAPPCAKAC